ncbi:MAG: hypothetical protein K2M82_04500 [Lachnospiraceae bacterium]|nr:hypothetical protein [Lachnospiraceae bacterium]
MIKQYTGMKAEKTISNIPLPAGGYVAEIINAKVEEYDWGTVVVIAFDIAEGEHKSFFQKQFDSNPNEDKKWKGTYRIIVPDENSKFFQSNQKTFNNFIYALEDSNNGYHYDCDEKKFKGKKLGVIYRDKEWEMNGNSGWTTECGAVTDITAIRENTFKVLKPKPLKNSTSSPNTSGSPSANDITDDDDLPF